MLAIARQLVALGPGAGPRSLHLLWVARNDRLFAAFAHMLDPLLTPPAGLRVAVHLYATAKYNNRVSGREKERVPSAAGLSRLSRPDGSRGSLAERLLSLGPTLSTAFEADTYQDGEMAVPQAQLNPLVAGAGLEMRPKPGKDLASEAAGGKGLKFPVKNGRPNLEELFSKVAEEVTDPAEVCCLVCGPVALTKSASALSFQHKFEFQAEEFVI